MRTLRRRTDRTVASNGTADAAGDAAPLLDVRGLTVEFATRRGVVQAVRDVDIRIAPGETVALLGESGSGKSVTAQAIMGILPRDVSRVAGGSVLYAGEDLLRVPARRLRELRGAEIAMVFQDPMSSLNPVMRIGYQLSEALWRKGGATRRAARARAIELMEIVGIPEAMHRIDDYPHQFSGGMRQRIMIAMALARDPKLLIADEPTTALDVTVQAQIMELLARVQDEFGMALLLITHDLGVVADTADRVYVMYAGSIIESGPTRGAYDYPSHPYTEGLLASIPSEYGDGQRLNPIPGSPPLPSSEHVGCPFAPRCPYATVRCRDHEPELRHPAGWPADRVAACHRSEEVLRHD